MSHVPPSAHQPPLQSRLGQLVSELASQAPRESHPCFAERLGRLFGLGDTMDLDAALAFRCKQPLQPSDEAGDTLHKDLAATRRKLTERLQQCFASTATDTQPGLPEPPPESGDGNPPSFTRYLDFYLARQREVAAGTRQLRTRARSTLARHSAALAQLAELDTVFDHTLAHFTSQSFATLPGILEKRFLALHQAEPGPRPWLDQFCQEMQMLLLAELELRLEPVLGLIDAFEHSNDAI